MEVVFLDLGRTIQALLNSARPSFSTICPAPRLYRIHYRRSSLSLIWSAPLQLSYPYILACEEHNVLAACRPIFAMFTPQHCLTLCPLLVGLICASARFERVTEHYQGRLFSYHVHRNPPQATSVSPIQMFLKCTLAVFCYSIRLLSLHRVWFSAYHLTWDEDNSDLENPPTSRRSRWIETLQKMKRVWTLIIMVSSLIITWALLFTECNWCSHFELRLSVTFLQIDQIVNNIYIRTFAILACVLSSASLAASCIFVVNGENLDCVEKFRRWEIASQSPNAMPSVDFWTCLASPLTSLAWYAPVFPWA